MTSGRAETSTQIEFQEEMKMKKFAALLIAMILVLSAAALAEGTVFKMGIDPEYPPFTYLGGDGEYTGYDVTLAQGVCDILGWELEVVPINWDTKLIQLDANEVDCIWSGLTIDVISPDEYSLSAAYVDSTQVVITKADSDITTLADLAGKVVGVQLGTSADILISDGGDQADLGATFKDIVRTESYNVAFTELSAGSVDAIAIDLSIAQNLIGGSEDYVILDESIASEQYGICFRLADAEMRDAVEGAFSQLVENGTYLSLAEKYDVDTASLCLLAE